MIQAQFKRNSSDEILSFQLTGHAEAGPYGSDVVCAAVSALSINAVNSIEMLAGFEPIVEVDEMEGGFLGMELIRSITPEQQTIAQILLESLLLGLQNIEEEHTEFIQVEIIN